MTIAIITHAVFVLKKHVVLYAMHTEFSFLNDVSRFWFAFVVVPGRGQTHKDKVSKKIQLHGSFRDWQKSTSDFMLIGVNMYCAYLIKNYSPSPIKLIFS
jgi:hypothetical protein